MKNMALSPILWIVAIVYIPACTSDANYKTCGPGIQKNNIQEPCDAFQRIDSRVLCSGSEQYSQTKCEQNNVSCCYYQEMCYRKPIKCYIDLRKELCWSYKTFQTGIYQGYSANGSYCFVENIHSFFEENSQLFARVLGPGGVKIYDEKKKDDFCVRSVLTNVTRTPDGNCTVQYKSTDSAPPFVNIGRTWANQCILQKGMNIIPFAFGQNVAKCSCRVDSWLEKSFGEKLSVSQTIRTYVEEEENCSVYTQILGRLVRASWRERLEIVNKGEAIVIIDALLNLTDSQNIMTQDAEVMLDTSLQLSKYKFYEGFGKDTPESLIKSTAKVMSNLIRHVNNEEPASLSNVRTKNKSPRDIYAPQALRSAQPAPLMQSSTDVRWRIFQNLEKISENMASLIILPKAMSKFVANASEKSLDLQVAIVRSKDASQLVNVSHKPEGDTKRQLQSIQLANIPAFNSGENENIAVISSFYKTSLPDNDSSKQHRVSDVLAVNLRSMNHGTVLNNLSWPVRFSLSHGGKNITTNLTSVCAFANETNENVWTEYGCWKEHADNSSTTCYCNHTTHFAVLFKYTEPELSQLDTRILEFLSISFGSIAVTSLSATCLVFIVYRKLLLKERLLIHFNLIIALLGGYVSLLLGSLFVERQMNFSSACFAAAISTHLFFLATFFWFLVEGLYLFYKVVLVFSSKRAEQLVKYSAIVGWACPAFIVAVCTIVSRSLPEIEGNYDRYYDSNTCFLQIRNGMIWAFVGPVLVILFVNACILCKVLIVIFRSTWTSTQIAKSTSDEKMSDSLKNSAKGAMILLPILGIPWLVGLSINFQVAEDDYRYVATIGSYIYVTLMGLQGVSIFLIYCVYNAEVRNAFRLSAERRKSVATIVSDARKRKRSKTPLLTSNDTAVRSPSLFRSKAYSLQTVTPKLSAEDTPSSSSPSSSPSKLLSLPVVTTTM